MTRNMMLFAVLAMCACADTEEALFDPPSVEGLQAHLGGAAAGGFLNGTFVLASNQPGEINAEQAQTLALALIEQWSTSLGQVISYDVGHEVDATKLEPCNAVYAASSYERSLDGPLNSVDLLFGPFWLVDLCEAGGELVAVAAVHARTPVGYTGNLMMFAGVVGVRSKSKTLLSAEQAAAAVVQATGRTVTEVPELLAPAILDGVPQFYSRWRVRVGNPVAVVGRRFSDLRNASEFFVGRDLDRDFREDASDYPVVLVATPNQPGGFNRHGIAKARRATLRFEPWSCPGFVDGLRLVCVRPPFCASFHS